MFAGIKCLKYWSHDLVAITLMQLSVTRLLSPPILCEVLSVENPAASSGLSKSINSLDYSRIQRLLHQT